MRVRIRWLILGSLVILLLISTGAALADGENLSRWRVGAGGMVESGGLRFGTSIGEPVGGYVSSAGGALHLCTGFWCGPAPGGPSIGPGGYKLYLPMTMH